MTNEEAMRIIGNLPVYPDDCYCVTEYQEAKTMAIEALEQEPCEDCISRRAIKQKLQEHHDFFVNAYGGFSNLPQNDKSRVDEITNCIAMVVNEPSVAPQPKIGRWITSSHGFTPEPTTVCSECGFDRDFYIHPRGFNKMKVCPNCGAKMEEVEE